MAIAYLVNMVLMFFPGIPELISDIFLGVVTIIGFSQFVFYFRIFDPFFKKKEGYNVSGVVKPSEEPKFQIIIGGHHDSVREYTFLRKKFQYWYGIRILLGTIVYLLVVAVMIADEIHYLIVGAQFPWFGGFRIFVLAASILVLQFYFFEGKQITPGAGDNLIASTMAVKIGELFREMNKKGEMELKHTQIVLLSTDAEEAGLRGAMAFAKKYDEQLHKIPTAIINIDSIYDADEIQILTRDINGFTPLAENLAKEVKGVADALGYKTRLFPFKFFGGGTDSGAYARAGVDSTTIIGMSTDTFRDGLYYHTVDDTVEHIEPESVEMCLDILANYVAKKEKELQEKYD